MEFTGGENVYKSEAEAYIIDTYRIPPGSTVTRAPTIVEATGKDLVSTILMEPP